LVHIFDPDARTESSVFQKRLENLLEVTKTITDAEESFGAEKARKKYLVL
jgi:hypothetical protein